ncbi:hypothetical protein IHC93_19980 [Photobacterium damselae subsp. damselae]|uniref:glycine-rich domain-containing protein n=1 Tax=Photobacterium damselae TaxID=38293 RepID=UPI001F1B48F1|nr:hypothetical protein [Photobacterium damselae]UKA27205.1 hypothetical protein IHC93_19980 [Photobacterium damselae subsp. damselae]
MTVNISRHKHNHEPHGKTSLTIAEMLASSKLRIIPDTGPISATMINTELGRAAASQLSLNDPAARALAEKTSGEIKYSDFRGKPTDPFIREDIFDDDTPFTLDPQCTRIEYEIVGGGGGGAGSHSYTNTDSGNGAGGGGAAQYKEGSVNIDSTSRNLYLIVGKGGQRGRGGQCSGNPSTTAENGKNGTNTDIRVSSSTGTVLAWSQGGYGGLVPEQSAYGWSGAGGNDGDGNPGGAHVSSGSNINGNTGSGRAGGSGGARGGHGGAAGSNGGGWDVTPPTGNEMAGCGGGGGKSAAPWNSGDGGKGGATALKALVGHSWLFYKATDATGFGNGGGGGCKTGNWTDMVTADAGSGGNGSNGRIIIRQYRR